MTRKMIRQLKVEVLVEVQTETEEALAHLKGYIHGKPPHLDLWACDKDYGCYSAKTIGVLNIDEVESKKAVAKKPKRGRVARRDA